MGHFGDGVMEPKLAVLLLLIGLILSLSYFSREDQPRAKTGNGWRLWRGK